MSLSRKSFQAIAFLPLLALTALPGCGPDEPPRAAPGPEYPAPYDSAGALPGPTPAGAARPDILLVLIEQWDRAWFIASRGAPRGGKRDDLIVTDAVTPVPEPAAAIASLLTGRIASRHGVSDRDPLPLLHEGYVTLPEILRSQGYATRAFVAGERLARGRSLWQGCDIDPQRVGLAEAPAALSTWVSSLPAGTPYFAVVHADEALPPYGEENHLPREVEDPPPQAVLDTPEAYADLFLTSRTGWSSVREQRRRSGGGAAVADLERQVKRFLWAPPASALDRTDPRSLASRAAAASLRASGWIDDLADRLDEVAGSLRTRPRLTVWTSTGGSDFGADGTLGAGRFLHEGQIHVPLMFGGLNANQRLESVASLVDILPTVLDHLQVPAPAEIDGVSLLPVARGAAHRAPVVSEATQDGENTGDPTVRANLVSVRSLRWKYVVRLDLKQGTVVEEAYEARRGERSKNLAEAGSVSKVPFDAAMCAAIERIRDGIWQRVKGHNDKSVTIYTEGQAVKGDRPAPCGR